MVEIEMFVFRKLSDRQRKRAGGGGGGWEVAKSK